MRCSIKTEGVILEAEIFDSRLGRMIYDSLPFQAAVHRWGEEIYFSIPVTCEPESLQETVEYGDLAYWRPGKAFCIFFGTTPASKQGEIRPASSVEVFGKIDGQCDQFSRIPDSRKIIVERI